MPSMKKVKYPKVLKFLDEWAVESGFGESIIRKYNIRNSKNKKVAEIQITKIKDTSGNENVFRVLLFEGRKTIYRRKVQGLRNSIRVARDMYNSYKKQLV